MDEWRPDPVAEFGPDPEAAIAQAAKRYSNWNRWGSDDGIGTVNFIGDAKRAAATRVARRGARAPR